MYLWKEKERCNFLKSIKQWRKWGSISMEKGGKDTNTHMAMKQKINKMPTKTPWALLHPFSIMHDEDSISISHPLFNFVKICNVIYFSFPTKILTSCNIKTPTFTLPFIHRLSYSLVITKPNSKEETNCWIEKKYLYPPRKRTLPL